MMNFPTHNLHSHRCAPAIGCHIVSDFNWFLSNMFFHTSKELSSHCVKNNALCVFQFIVFFLLLLFLHKPIKTGAKQQMNVSQTARHTITGGDILTHASFCRSDTVRNIQTTIEVNWPATFTARPAMYYSPSPSYCPSLFLSICLLLLHLTYPTLFDQSHLVSFVYMCMCVCLCVCLFACVCVYALFPFVDHARYRCRWGPACINGDGDGYMFFRLFSLWLHFRCTSGFCSPLPSTLPAIRDPHRRVRRIFDCVQRRTYATSISQPDRRVGASGLSFPADTCRRFRYADSRSLSFRWSRSYCYRSVARYLDRGEVDDRLCCWGSVAVAAWLRSCV